MDIGKLKKILGKRYKVLLYIGSLILLIAVVEITVIARSVEYKKEYQIIEQKSSEAKGDLWIVIGLLFISHLFTVASCELAEEKKNSSKNKC